MLISDTKKFVFVHIPKTGGESIMWALYEGYCIPICKPPQIGIKHLSAHQLKRMFFENTPDRSWKEYFSFGIVRNPWERLHSDYWFCKLQQEIPGEQFGQWREKVLRVKKQTFTEFIEDECPQHKIEAGVGIYKRFLTWKNSDRQLVTKVVRFENLRKAWPLLLERMSIPFTSLPHRNKTPNRPDYHKEYTDRAKELIRVCFADDIERFGYSF